MQDRLEYAVRHAVVELIMVLIYCVIYLIVAAVRRVFDVLPWCRGAPVGGTALSKG